MYTLDYLPNHPELKIYQDDKLIKINTDTQVLGEFIEVYKDDIVMDIGTNTGALLIYANQFSPKKLIGIDINKEALDVCKMNMELHNITNYELKCCDAMNYTGDEVDVIICNPPYFKTEEDNNDDNDDEEDDIYEGVINPVKIISLHLQNMKVVLLLKD